MGNLEISSTKMLMDVPRQKLLQSSRTRFPRASLSRFLQLALVHPLLVSFGLPFTMGRLLCGCIKCCYLGKIQDIPLAVSHVLMLLGTGLCSWHLHRCPAFTCGSSQAGNLVAIHCSSSDSLVIISTRPFIPESNSSSYERDRSYRRQRRICRRIDVR